MAYLRDVFTPHHCTCNHTKNKLGLSKGKLSFAGTPEPFINLLIYRYLKIYCTYQKIYFIDISNMFLLLVKFDNRAVPSPH